VSWPVKAKVRRADALKSGSATASTSETAAGRPQTPLGKDSSWRVARAAEREAEAKSRGDKLYINSHQEGPVYLRLTDFGSAMGLTR